MQISKETFLFFILSYRYVDFENKELLTKAGKRALNRFAIASYDS